MDCRRIFVAHAIVQREIVFHLIGVLPVGIPGIPLPVTKRRAKEQRRGVGVAAKKVGEVDETEVATGGSIQESAGVFAADMVAPAPGVLGGAQWRDQRHIVVELVCVGYAALWQVAGASQGSKASTDIDRRQAGVERSEEHTSELQSRSDLVCRLLLEKKNKKHKSSAIT